MSWEISAELLHFCKENDDIPPQIYTHISRALIPVDGGFSVPDRYFCLNPFVEHGEPSLDEISANLDAATVRKVPFLRGFYATAGSAKISQASLYKRNALLCMDISSALAVEALDIQPGMNVLDICCAPGAKLCFIASKLIDRTEPKFMGYGTITGVDISEHRLSTCKSLVKKLCVPKCRLFLGDGTLFQIPPPLFNAQSFQRATFGTAEPQPIMQKHFYCAKVLRTLRSSNQKYDRVIVDAECTHDGSITHLLKKDSINLAPERLEQLFQLQLSLLQNGFDNLKHGGKLVYSTCSLSHRQNEDIVERFLELNSDASLEAFEGGGLLPKADPEVEELFRSRSRKGMLRYHGTNCHTSDGARWWLSGFFLVVIIKAERHV